MTPAATETERDLAERVLRVGPRLGRLMAATARELGGLTPDRARILKQLSAGPLRSGELAERCLLTRPAITEVVDELVREELVRRDEDPGDRRVVVLTLTARGRREVERFHDRLATVLGEVLSRLAPAERQRLRAAFVDLERVLTEVRDVR